MRPSGVRRFRLVLCTPVTHKMLLTTPSGLGHGASLLCCPFAQRRHLPRRPEPAGQAGLQATSSAPGITVETLAATITRINPSSPALISNVHRLLARSGSSNFADTAGLIGFLRQHPQHFVLFGTKMVGVKRNRPTSSASIPAPPVEDSDSPVAAASTQQEPPSSTTQRVDDEPLDDARPRRDPRDATVPETVKGEPVLKRTGLPPIPSPTTSTTTKITTPPKVDSVREVPQDDRRPGDSSPSLRMKSSLPPPLQTGTSARVVDATEKDVENESEHPVNDRAPAVENSANSVDHHEPYDNKLQRASAHSDVDDGDEPKFVDRDADDDYEMFRGKSARRSIGKNVLPSPPMRQRLSPGPECDVNHVPLSAPKRQHHNDALADLEPPPPPPPKATQSSGVTVGAVVDFNALFDVSPDLSYWLQCWIPHYYVPVRLLETVVFPAAVNNALQAVSLKSARGSVTEARWSTKRVSVEGGDEADATTDEKVLLAEWRDSPLLQYLLADQDDSTTPEREWKDNAFSFRTVGSELYVRHCGLVGSGVPQQEWCIDGFTEAILLRHYLEAASGGKATFLAMTQSVIARAPEAARRKSCIVFQVKHAVALYHRLKKNEWYAARELIHPTRRPEKGKPVEKEEGKEGSAAEAEKSADEAEDDAPAEDVEGAEGPQPTYYIPYEGTDAAVLAFDIYSMLFEVDLPSASVRARPDREINEIMRKKSLEANSLTYLEDSPIPHVVRHLYRSLDRPKHMKYFHYMIQALPVEFEKAIDTLYGSRRDFMRTHGGLFVGAKVGSFVVVKRDTHTNTDLDNCLQPAVQLDDDVQSILDALDDVLPRRYPRTATALLKILRQYFKGKPPRNITGARLAEWLRHDQRFAVFFTPSPVDCFIGRIGCSGEGVNKCLPVEDINDVAFAINMSWRKVAQAGGEAVLPSADLVHFKNLSHGSIVTRTFGKKNFNFYLLQAYKTYFTQIPRGRDKVFMPNYNDEVMQDDIREAEAEQTDDASEGFDENDEDGDACDEYESGGRLSGD